MYTFSQVECAAVMAGVVLSCATHAATVGVGALRVEVNELGVITGVPAGGVRTVDGPVVTMTAGFAEWYGLSFRIGDRSVHAAASGTAADWANRPAVRPVSTSVAARTRVASAAVR